MFTTEFLFAQQPIIQLSFCHQLMLFQIGHTLALPKNQLRIRVIDFYRWDPSPHEVIRIEYDSNRSSHLKYNQ
ncbi:hypothetical protein RhiirA4_456742 [Rhizophagus irregularis]|uniref:Large ribosomal subunit protein uL2 RNA-binding domain-containing protein n=1 Tax=Rhizophagus irregularis TaxID=588596 RepID=A0A2I1G895_9GLOM|nr:hypothetical protein RhiirA4_456742 [Rhizophagus irregularis]